MKLDVQILLPWGTSNCPTEPLLRRDPSSEVGWPWFSELLQVVMEREVSVGLEVGGGDKL